MSTEMKGRIYTFAVLLVVAAMIIGVWKLLPGH